MVLSKKEEFQSLSCSYVTLVQTHQALLSAFGSTISGSIWSYFYHTELPCGVRTVIYS